MESERIRFDSMDEYIESFPKEIQIILQEIREEIKKAVPEAEEKISYQMPTFFLNGNLIHFAAFKKHIGVYPTPNGIEAFEKELMQYKRAKGSVQFPLGKPIPLGLIGRIAAYRAEQNRKKK